MPANLLAFLIASSAAFLPWNDMLLIGIDGEYTRNSAVQLSRFGSLFPGLSMAVFESLGTLFSYNPLISPSLLPIAMVHSAFGVWLGFMICAALIFCSTYAFGRSIGMSRGISVLAGWLLPPLCLPYQPWLNLYMTFNLNPIAGDTVSFTLLALALLARGYRSGRPQLLGVALLAVVIWLFLANPIWLMLLIPSIIPMSIGIMGCHARKIGFFVKSAILFIPAVIFVALAGAPYLFGIYSDTAVAFFPQEMNKGIPRSLRLCSVATATGTGLDPIGTTWVGLALIGVGLAIIRGQGILRAAAIAVLAAILLLGGYAALYLTSSSWVLPYPIYFEFFVWPSYALFAAYAIGQLLGRNSHQFPQIQVLAGRMIPMRSRSWPVVVSWVVVGMILAVLLASNPFSIRPNLYYLPSEDTAITNVLRSEIGIAPNAPFKGYVATLTGFGGPHGPPADWFRVLAETNDAFLKFRNTHRMPYLWRFNIPTLEAYSQTVEPAMYAVVSRLLDRPGDGQVRNITIVTHTNFPVMESLGVRFLITDYPISRPARLVTELVTAPISHFLFELPMPNIGNYSPDQVIIARDALTTMQYLADPRFDFRKSVVLGEEIQPILRPAQESGATLVRGGWRVKASSGGASLALLPLQFSRCLSLVDHSQGRGRVISLQRANLAATGLLYEGDIDVTITLQVSPFWDPYCRIRDAREMKEFGLPDLPRSFIPTVAGGP